MKTYTEEYLRTQVGKKIKCVLDHPSRGKIIVDDAVLGTANPFLAICQNLINGRPSDDKHGYKYAWAFEVDEGSFFDYITEFEIL